MDDAPRRMRGLAADREPAHRITVERDAIAKQVNDADVVSEVELRMAELLSERGVSGDKVVLPADVTYIKEQLGSPDDARLLPGAYRVILQGYTGPPLLAEALTVPRSLR